MSKIKRLILNIVRFFKAGCRTKYVDYVGWLRKQGIKVGKNVYFRNPEHTTIDVSRPSLIEFGNDLDINDNFCVLTHDFGTFVFRNLWGDFVNSSGKVVIGNNIVFGRNVTVFKGVTIGDNSIIGANSVITKNTPPPFGSGRCASKGDMYIGGVL